MCNLRYFGEVEILLLVHFYRNSEHFLKTLVHKKGDEKLIFRNFPWDNWWSGLINRENLYPKDLKYGESCVESIFAIRCFYMNLFGVHFCEFAQNFYS